MNIIHVLPELEGGGVERIVPVYANGQARLGHNVCVVSHGGNLESLLSPAVRHIKMPAHRKNPLIGMGVAIRMARLARAEGVDVIHAHSRMPAWIGYFTKKFARGVKFVFTAHARFSTLNCVCWPIARADGATCVSHAVMSHLKGWLPPEDRVRVIYNPLPRRVAPWSGSGDEGKKHLLYVGRVSEKKGLLMVIEAMAALKGKNWVLDILGDGPRMKDARELVKNLGLDGRVSLNGFSNDVTMAISRCDLFLFPSRDEGLSLSLMEALASGAPVIASDIPATRELVSERRENPNGELLDSQDTAAWSAAIGSYLDGKFSPTLEIALKLPTADEMVAEMTGFYEEILKNGR